MKKILLTGVAGFIGWKTCEFLLESGAEVVGIDNLNSYYDVALKEHRLRSLAKYEQFRFHKIDIEDLGALQGIFSAHQFEAVINLAARAGVRYSMENPFVYMTTNGQGTLNLLTVMNEHKVKKMVLASTSSLYAGQPMPFREDLPVNTPISPYAASKKAAEVMAYTYHYLYGLDISVVRYFTVYGPAGRPDMSIFRFIKWVDEGVPLEIFGDGSQSRDFTFVDDIAQGTIKALQPVGYEIINLGGGRNPTSINEIISRIEKNLGKKARIDPKPFHKTDLKETWADISKAQKLLAWSPIVGLEEGLKKSIDWYLGNKSWVRAIKI
jgi:nucleoside-diphosphate-sugar epimerase